MQHRRRSLVSWTLIAWTLAACGGGPGSPGSPTVGPAATATAPSAASATATAKPEPTLAPGVTRMLDVDFRASGIVADDRYLWAEDHASTSAVYAIDPTTGDTVESFDLYRPCDVVVADGVIWAADLDAGEVVAIDATTLERIGEVDGLPGPCGLQFTGGYLWMVADPGLARVDPEARTAEVFDFGGGTFPGAGTPLWVTAFGSGELSRIDLDSGERLVTIPAPGGPAELIALQAAFGAVWAGNEASGMVYRLEPDSGAIQAEIDTMVPARFLATEDGLWLTSYAGGTVERIDPETNEVVFRTRIGGSPNGITEGFGSIWVSDTANGRFFAIDPSATGLFE
jgi:outer membrane protein assembly factor BamB